MGKYDKKNVQIEKLLIASKSKQLNHYYMKKLENQNLSTKIDVPSADGNGIIMFKFIETHASNERQQYDHAKKLFNSILRYLPSGVFKHFTMMVIEHDRKINKYGDLI